MMPREVAFEVFAITPADRVFRAWLDLRDAVPTELYGISFSVALELSALDADAFRGFAPFTDSLGIREPLAFIEFLRQRKLHGELIESLTHALLNRQAVIHLSHVPEHLFRQIRETVYRKLYMACALSPEGGGEPEAHEPSHAEAMQILSRIR